MSPRIGKLIGSAVIGSSLLFCSAAMALAQTNTTLVPSASVSGTTTTVTDTSSSSTPGIPNTGAGGDATNNMIILTVSALVAIGGGLYLMRQRYATR